MRFLGANDIFQFIQSGLSLKFDHDLRRARIIINNYRNVNRIVYSFIILIQFFLSAFIIVWGEQKYAVGFLFFTVRCQLYDSVQTGIGDSRQNQCPLY